MAWDDFPNGRWGNRDSPAYGEPFYSMCKDPDERSLEHRREMWMSSLTSLDDVAKVFIAYIKGGATKRLPWCPDRIGDETNVIKRQLVKMNMLGLLTVNSQPRVNAALSSDPIFGWGPKGGFCYQKAYAEFFCDHTTLSLLMDVASMHKEWTLCAINSAGKVFCSPPKPTVECIDGKKQRKGSNTSSRSSGSSTNAVTWGVFPNLEVKQPTVVDEESFLTWAAEAFELWKIEWGSIYQEGSVSKGVINEIYNTWFLVNIVDNNFVSGDLFHNLICELEAKKQTPPGPHRLSNPARSPSRSFSAISYLDEDSQNGEK
eukprot:GHVN01028228.1.p1 GENE.GHVN01028228.1~~GHVN01028228.1.p1  ORF type:complete len:316 (+),score=43.07 GHVN01028228.1:1011-1958(+)